MSTTVRELDAAPATLGLFARAALPLVPGASRLPFVGGGGGQIPDLELVLSDVAVDVERLAAYAGVCGFTLRGSLPVTYPWVLAFPLQMALMTDPAFPFPAIGTVHLANRIHQHRPIAVDERLELRARPTPALPHRKGQQFGVVFEARAGDELVWESLGTFLRPGKPSEDARTSAPADDPSVPDGLRVSTSAAEGLAEPEGATRWRVPGDQGRRYAAVSGDSNPIHLYGLSAKLFGFPRQIAHGMWTKARSVAAIEDRLPGAFTVDVGFRKPVLLPATVAFGSVHDDRGHVRFALTDAKTGTPHLKGTVTPG